MPFVLDASVTASWAFPDEYDTVADRAADLLEAGSEVAFVPSLWWYEVRNTLLSAEHRGRTSQARSAEFLELLRDIRIQICGLPDEESTFAIARRHGLTIYDAAYLALAIEEQAPIATLDKSLRGAAIAEGIPLLA